jgi:hypothetical protein
MGRFDALTQLEERKDNKTPKELTDRIIVNRLDASAFSPPTTRQRGSTSTDKPAAPVPIPVPPPVPRTGRGTVPLIPKVKRAIRQRQPFDIYEDQYERLKKIAESEREFVNGRGMSQMVREAIDNYLKDDGSSKD